MCGLLSAEPETRASSDMPAGARGRSRKGLVIAFSGVDCCGKSTQISLLCDKFRSLGREPRWVWLRVGYTPGISALKELIRRIVGRNRIPSGDSLQRREFMSSSWKRRAWLNCAFADMIWQTAFRMRILRLLDQVTIADRYVQDSELDLLLNFGSTATRMWGWRLVKLLAARPDMHVFLDLPFAEAVSRAELKNEPFPDPHEQRRQRAFLYEERKSVEAWKIVDASKRIAEVAATVNEMLQL
jgi:thymidylate kinase